MIKIRLLALLFLTGCSSFAYNDSANYIYGYIFGFKSNVTKEFFNEFDYSFATVKFGRGPESVIVLSEIIDDEILKFVSSDNIKIYVSNGFVFNTEGFENDIRYKEFKNYVDYESITTFDNPSLYKAKTLNKFYDLGNDNIKRFDKNVSVNKVKHTLEIPIIGWKTDIFYYIGESGKVIRTEQVFHPQIPKAVINFYYK